MAFRKEFLLGLVCGVILGVAGLFIAMAAGWLDPRVPTSPGNEWGRFLKNPQVELLEEGRKVKLLDDFIYIDPRKKAWLAPKGHVVDGASIPRVFWTITGGPLDGPYRNASIVHDVECDEKREKWQDVHVLFYEACRCGGLAENKAKVMFWAVYHFGPRWETVREIREVMQSLPNGEKRVRHVEVLAIRDVTPSKPPEKTVLEQVEQFVNDKRPSLEQLMVLESNDFSKP